MIPSQLEMLEQPWDILIILDACRFDIFEELYPQWLKGELIKVKSSAPETVLWLRETWKNYYDLIYFSAHPYINSQGVPARGYIAADHFSKIINIWEDHWNTEFGTVYPIEVNKVVMETEIDRRAIIHYVQPHSPYIGRRGLDRAGWAEGRFRSRVLQIKESNKLGRRHRPHKVPFKEAYIETLDLVLQRVSELIPYLKGKVVVSTDHGELLGEDDEWGHIRSSKHPVIWEIPWFEVKGMR